MPIIRRATTIAAPPQAVWNVLVDMARQPEWMRDLKTVTLDEPGPIRVGSRGVGVVRMFGISQADPIVVTRFDPPRTYALRHLGRFAGSGTFELRPAGGESATLVSWTEELRLDTATIRLPGPLRRLPGLTVVTQAVVGFGGRCVDPLLAPLFKHVFRADLRRLRLMVERGEWSHGTDPRRMPSGTP